MNYNAHRYASVVRDRNLEVKRKQVSFLDDDGSKSRFSSVQLKTDDNLSTSVDILCKAKGPSMISGRW